MIIDHAIAYAERLGWPVLPLHSVEQHRPIRCSCGKPDCTSPGKHPRTRNGVHESTLDVAQIREWWRHWPDANIGIAGGVRWWALDIDGVDGENQIAGLEAKYGWKHEGPIQTSGSGGRHYFFLPDARVGNRVRFARGLDTRSNGGYLVAAPSGHSSGIRYRWHTPPRQQAVATAPEWLVELVSQRTPTIPAPRPGPPATDAMRRASAYLRTIEPAVSGQGGHGMLWRAALACVCRFGLPREQAMHLLVSEYNPRCQPPWSERELDHKVRSAEQQGHMSRIEDRPLRSAR